MEKENFIIIRVFGGLGNQLWQYALGRSLSLKYKKNLVLDLSFFNNPLIDLPKGILAETEGVFTLKNENTTLGFVRFNNAGEVEYIFVNPLFRKKKLAKNLLKLVRKKTQKKIVFQKPISPLGSKLLKSIENWN